MAYPSHAIMRAIAQASVRPTASVKSSSKQLRKRGRGEEGKSNLC
jgi:hypothetical protein